MSKWNPDKYLQFEKQRTQPSIDLAMRIQNTCPERIPDPGCGPGNSTAVLHKVFPGSQIIGIDNSPEMIEKARANYPDYNFEIRSAEDIEGKYDLIFSNACLQWIPDHEDLLPKLMTHLKEGGILAVQIPYNNAEPLFQIIAETVKEPKWGFENTVAETARTLSPGEYYNILSKCSSSFDVRETRYYHSMPDINAMLEWVKGSRLRPYLAALNTEKQEEFIQTLLHKAEKSYSPMNDGTISFGFNRLFFTAKL